MRIHYETMKSGDTYIGQVLEYPNIIAYASTKQELEHEMTVCAKGYFEAFPDETYKRKRNIQGLQFSNKPSNGDCVKHPKFYCKNCYEDNHPLQMKCSHCGELLHDG